ncbi:uncharacterized protein LOC119162295 [Rhipicephalus microplus]|uniref:uncharacterized protein LOC119162295 n=1 Tax=Rhipicephalus microplus TaxID=6941 RepID=UPI003F6D1B7C
MLEWFTFKRCISDLAVSISFVSRSVEDHTQGNHQEYFLVHQSYLVTLFNKYHTCVSDSVTVSLSCMGPQLTAKLECPQGHLHMRSSQPLVGRKPKGNINLSTVLLYSGSSLTSALSMMCHPYNQLVKVWGEHHEKLLTQLRETNLPLCGDGRRDSLGQSTKYLTYSFLGPIKKEIIHAEQMQVKEIPKQCHRETAAHIERYCAHNTLFPDSQPYKQIKDIVTTPFFLKDISQLSPSVQTHSLESFHSVLTNFATKFNAFTYESIRAR